MKLVKSDCGYYRVDPIPSAEELKEYYQKKYYQETKGSYQNRYVGGELKWKQFQEWLVVQGILKFGQRGKALDIGCGEGFLLKTLDEHGFDALGTDFSRHGIMTHNPELAGHFFQSNIEEYLEQVDSLREFDVISLLHVIEHVRHPKKLLETLKSKMHPNALLVIRFPNDNSKLHQYIQEHTETADQWWVASPDHISYFNHDSMSRLLAKFGFEVVGKVSDHPIDFNLLNQNSNYIMDRSKGRATHQYRVLLDNFLSELDPHGYYSILEQYAHMGVGRSLTFFVKNSES